MLATLRAFIAFMELSELSLAVCTGARGKVGSESDSDPDSESESDADESEACAELGALSFS